MELNKVSGLTLNDYKKKYLLVCQMILIKYSKIIIKYFIIWKKKYNINGLFLASMAIHESGWGTSQIANDKKKFIWIWFL